jgi:hypothetical protein
MKNKCFYEKCEGKVTHKFKLDITDLKGRGILTGNFCTKHYKGGFQDIVEFVSNFKKRLKLEDCK